MFYPTKQTANVNALVPSRYDDTAQLYSKLTFVFWITLAGSSTRCGLVKKIKTFFFKYSYSNPATSHQPSILILRFKLNWFLLEWTYQRDCSNRLDFSKFCHFQLQDRLDFCIFNRPKVRTPHNLFMDFSSDKSFTTRWSGGRVQVWVQVQAPAANFAITPEGYSRRQSKILAAKSMAKLLKQHSGTAWAS